ncbi:MAG: sigma-70 family RNA polymerase sigma factor [Clostridia bacterium]
MSEQANQSKALIERAQSGDSEAMSQMVEGNLALVKYVVKRFQGVGRDWDDLYQLGCMGLVKAIRNFNTAFDVRFSTYAVPVILGEVRRFLRDDGPIRVSRSIKDNARKIAGYIEQIEREHGRTPTLSEMADALGIDREEALLAFDSLRPTRSLSEPVGVDGTMTLGDTVGEDRMYEVDQRLLIEQLLGTLSDVEREVLTRRYFGLETQSQIAGTFGMTQVQVSRLEAKLLKRLRDIAQTA